jgi:hypothetical protein
MVGLEGWLACEEGWEVVSAGKGEGVRRGGVGGVGLFDRVGG